MRFARINTVSKIREYEPGPVKVDRKRDLRFIRDTDAPAIRVVVRKMVFIGSRVEDAIADDLYKE